MRKAAARLPLGGLVAVTVWGASFVATRVALESFTPFGLVAVRTWAGALLLTGILLGRGGAVWPRRGDRRACLLLGAVLVLHLVLQAEGLRFTSAVHTGWIIGFIPVTVAIGAQLLGQQRLTRSGWAGVGLGAGGILLVILSEFHTAVRGDLLQLGSCFTWTVYTLAAAGAVARSGPLRVTALSMACAATLVTVGAAAEGPLRAPLTVRVLLAVAFLGPVCSGLAYYLWFAAQRTHGPARTGALIYLEPFVSLVTGRMLLNEAITLPAVVGGLCVLGGVWLVSRGARDGGGTRAVQPVD